MSISEEQTECPLCMELLEMDDINFYPCTCGYQICRFCWHRIRTDENGLCPACRKQYPEDPAEFKPLTEEELQRIKKDRRQKDLQRKQKAAENRKHLANVRVVQKNLVFIVGLSQRLAEADVLRKHEYFGKFGKLHKVVINQSTSYAGAQGPSASAYVTYNRAEDALRAIQAVNNIHFDGRTLKASLGTTKYCSHFLRGAQCPKPDCMYLHELGEEAASFTKEEMQQGKHQEYEQKLHEQFMNSQNLVSSHQVGNKTQMCSSPPDETVTPLLCFGLGAVPLPPNTSSNNNRTVAPSMSPPRTSPPQQPPPPPPPSVPSPPHTAQHSPPVGTTTAATTAATAAATAAAAAAAAAATAASIRKLTFINNGGVADSMSLFSGNGFAGLSNPKSVRPPQPTEEHVRPPPAEIPDTLPAVVTSTDWQAAFGFSSSGSEPHDDDLGFDPWDESSKALADLIEKEGPTAAGVTYQACAGRHQGAPPPGHGPPPKGLPPGFSANHFGNMAPNGMVPPGGAKMATGFAPMGRVPPQNHTYHDMLSDVRLRGKSDWRATNSHTPHDAFSVKDWQDGLRALLPNINISFGGAQQPTGATAPLPATPRLDANPPPTQRPPNQNAKDARLGATYLARDPAIITSGDVADSSSDEPHWMASLQQLTDETPASRRLPFVQQFHAPPPPPPGREGWPLGAAGTAAPPPGFHMHQTQLRQMTTDTQPLAADGLQ